MTLEEAQKVADVATTADGYCSHCQAEMVEVLNDTFPEFIWRYWEGEDYAPGIIVALKL